MAKIMSQYQENVSWIFYAPYLFITTVQERPYAQKLKERTIGEERKNNKVVLLVETKQMSFSKL